MLIVVSRELDSSGLPTLAPDSFGTWQVSEVLPERCTAGVVLVVTTSFSHTELQWLIEEIHERALPTRTILLVNPTPEDALRVGQIWRGQTSWLGDVEHLERQITALLARDLRTELAEALRHACPSQPALDALTFAFRNDPPFRSLAGLAEAFGTTESRLRKVFREAGWKARAEAVLDWALLAAAVPLLERFSVARAGYRLGVTSARLQRAAYRRTGTAVGGLDRSAVLQAFVRWLERHLAPAKGRSLLMPPG